MLKLVGLPSLRVICWKRAKIWIRTIEKFPGLNFLAMKRTTWTKSTAVHGMIKKHPTKPFLAISHRELFKMTRDSMWTVELYYIYWGLMRHLARRGLRIMSTKLLY